MEQVVWTKRKCLRCGYEWLPRMAALPKACPQCKNRRWDKPRKEKAVETGK